MKKFVLSVMAVLFIASSAFAAVSSPCTAKKPARVAAPREPEKYRRDVLDFRVPVETSNDANIDRIKATEDREKLAP